MSTSDILRLHSRVYLTRSDPKPKLSSGNTLSGFLGRILVRMQAKGVTDFQIYCREMQTSPAECDALIAALSIKLKYFMHDARFRYWVWLIAGKNAHRGKRWQRYCVRYRENQQHIYCLPARVNPGEMLKELE